MAEIIAGIVLVLLGLVLGFCAFMTFLVEADAHQFNADAGLGFYLAGFSLGSLASFALAAWLFF